MAFAAAIGDFAHRHPTVEMLNPRAWSRGLG